MGASRLGCKECEARGGGIDVEFMGVSIGEGIAMAKREYTKDGLTVLWDSEKCEHCEACWRGLPSVFDPQSRPWVNMNGATTEEIRKQVELCPPQALSVKESSKDGEIVEG